MRQYTYYTLISYFSPHNLYIIMKLFILILCGVTLLSACTKSTGSDYQACFENFHLTVRDTAIYAGDDVTIYASDPYAIYRWVGPNNFFYDAPGNDNELHLQNISISQSGWYYAHASGPQCNPASDSIYINVRYPQNTPSCTVTDNTISNTAGVPNLSNYSVTKDFDASTNGIAVEAFYSIGAPVYYFYFNSNNGNTEPKDGTYKTKNMYVFDGDDDANTVNVACNYFPFYFNSHDNQEVYVTHVNGKIRITFCSLNMSDGDNGGAQGLFTGQVTEK